MLSVIVKRLVNDLFVVLIFKQTLQSALQSRFNSNPLTQCNHGYRSMYMKWRMHGLYTGLPGILFPDMSWLNSTAMLY